MGPMRQQWGILLATVGVVVWLAWPRGGELPRFEARLGFDTSFDARKMAATVAVSPTNALGGWMRLRVPDHDSPFTARSETRTALRELRRHGMRSFVLLAAAGYPWPSGVRDLPAAKGSLPLDLRDAFARGKWLGKRYGADVDAWELDNEPELIYVRDNPENYAAYLKAMYWGLQRGAVESQYRFRGEVEASKRKRTASLRGELKSQSERNSKRSTSTARGARLPHVVMAPMAFPPGPYFDALLDNDLLSYTDGFNFHYYGYEEDFPGVYRQFEAAVNERSERSALQTERPENGGRRTVGFAGNKDQVTNDKAVETDVKETPTQFPPVQLGFDGKQTEAGGVASGDAGDHLLRKRLPIFISEYGYGILSGRTATTTEGRVRQWEYFRALAGHMRELRVQAPMAFVLSPYLEDGAREFGLTMRTVVKTTGSREQAAVALLAPDRTDAGGTFFSAGGAVFTPVDFGVNAPEPWMRDIGRRFGDFEISPALAWLLHQPPLPEPREWDVTVSAPSPVVIDFVAGTGMRQSKSSRGHFLTQMSALEAKGQGTVVLYNFGRKAMRGVLRVDGHAREPLIEQLELAPGERRDISLTFAVDRQPFQGVRWKATFVPDCDEVPPARLRSFVYPEAVGLRPQVLADFQHEPKRSAANAANLDSRRLARGEAPLRPDGRWRVTKGMRVEESGRVWRFTVNGFPDETLRPAIAELPLPDGFTFHAFDIFAADVRLCPRRAEDVALADEPRSEPEFSAIDKETAGFYFRSRAGGLYATAMHFPVSTSGMRFGQMAANFTPVFYGRMHLPWRFLETQPVSLVLIFRPRLLPATYEIRDARIVRLTK